MNQRTDTYIGGCYWGQGKYQSPVANG